MIASPFPVAPPRVFYDPAATSYCQFLFVPGLVSLPCFRVPRPPSPSPIADSFESLFFCFVLVCVCSSRSSLPIPKLLFFFRFSTFPLESINQKATRRTFCASQAFRGPLVRVFLTSALSLLGSFQFSLCPSFHALFLPVLSAQYSTPPPIRFLYRYLPRPLLPFDSL